MPTRLAEPYNRIQVPNEGTRTALAKLGRRAIKRKEPAFLYFNNRAEGYAPRTIEAVVE